MPADSFTEKKMEQLKNILENKFIQGLVVALAIAYVGENHNKDLAKLMKPDLIFVVGFISALFINRYIYKSNAQKDHIDGVNISDIISEDQGRVSWPRVNDSDGVESGYTGVKSDNWYYLLDERDLSKKSNIGLPVNQKKLREFQEKNFSLEVKQNQEPNLDKIDKYNDVDQKTIKKVLENLPKNSSINLVRENGVQFRVALGNSGLYYLFQVNIDLEKNNQSTIQEKNQKLFLHENDGPKLEENSEMDYNPLFYGVALENTVKFILNLNSDQNSIIGYQNPEPLNKFERSIVV